MDAEIQQETMIADATAEFYGSLFFLLYVADAEIQTAVAVALATTGIMMATVANGSSCY